MIVIRNEQDILKSMKTDKDLDVGGGLQFKTQGMEDLMQKKSYNQNGLKSIYNINMQALHKENKLLKQLSTALERQNECRNREKDALLQQIQQLMMTNDNLHRQISQLKAQNTNLTLNQKQLIQELSQIRTNQCNYQRQINDLRTTIDQLTKQIKGLQPYNIKQFNHLQKHEYQNGQDGRIKNAQIIELQDRRENGQCLETDGKNIQGMGERIGEVGEKYQQTDPRNVNQQLQKAKKEIRELKNALICRQSPRLTFSDSNLQKLEMKILDKDNQIVKLHQLTENLKRQIQTIKNQYCQNNSPSTQIASLRQVIDEKYHEIEILNSKNKEYSAEIITLLTKKEEMELIEREMEILKNRVRAAELELTNKEIQLVKVITDERQISRVKDELKIANQENSKLYMMIRDQKNYIDELQTKISSMEQQRRINIDKMPQLLQQLSHKNLRIDKLQTQLENLQQKSETPVAENIETPQLSIESNQKNHQQETQQKNKMIDLINKLKKQNREIKGQIRNQKEVIDLVDYDEIYGAGKNTREQPKKLKKIIQRSEEEYQGTKCQDSVRNVVRKLKMQLSHKKLNFEKIEEENKQLQNIIKTKLDDDSVGSGFQRKNQSNIVSPHGYRERLDESKSSGSSLHKNQSSSFLSQKQLWKYPQSDAIKVVRQGRNQGSQWRKRGVDTKKQEKWANLEKRISMLQQQNKELKKTLLN